MKLTILVDNYSSQVTSLTRRLLSEWGFSAYLHDFKILYDTGLSGTALLNNMERLGIDVNEPEYLVLSHRHLDHTGGVRKFLEKRNRKIKLIAHKNIFSKAYVEAEGKNHDISFNMTKEEIEKQGEITLIDKPYEIAKNVIVSGEIPRQWGPSHVGGVNDIVPDDMSMYLITNKGLVIVTGCGHAGPENIIEYGLQITGITSLYGIIGGLHFLGLKEDRVSQVEKYLKEKSPKIVVGSHCTGVYGIARINAIPGGVGYTAELPDIE